MNILLAYQFCDLGGIQAIMGALGRRFKARGHHCELFFFNAGPALAQYPADWKVHVGGLAELMRVAESGRFDVVHAITEDWPTGISAVRHLRGARTALVLSSQGRIVPHWNSRHCDGLIGCSGWDVKEQQRTADFEVKLIYNGIDLERFSPDGRGASAKGGGAIVAWVGRGSDLKQKRIDILAGAARKMKEVGLRLWIADPDGPTKVVVSAARVLESAAERWGKVAWEQMPAFYREVAASGGVVLSTAAFEGLPLSLAEAQACGCPVIGADVRGVNECVRPEKGGVLYAAETSPEELAELVIATVRDEPRMEERRRECAAFAAACFGLDRMVEEHLEEYAGAIRRRSAWHVFGKGWTEAIWNRAARHGGWRMVPATRQYEASLGLMKKGKPRIAAAAARAAITTCPVALVGILKSFPHRLVHRRTRAGRAGDASGAQKALAVVARES